MSTTVMDEKKWELVMLLFAFTLLLAVVWYKYFAS